MTTLYIQADAGNYYHFFCWNAKGMYLNNAQLKVTDAIGRIVYLKNLTSQLSSFNFELSSGIYLVQLQLKEGICTKKIVVQ